MEILSLAKPRAEFSEVHAAMRRYVDGNLLAGVSHAVLQGRELIDAGCVGWADRENEVPLRLDHIFRVFSNTKLVTSCAVLLLVEAGRVGLDDPIEHYLPQLGDRRVLRPGATRLDDTQAADGPITVRHLLSHSSGLSYGLLDPGTLIFKAYVEHGVPSRQTTLAKMIDSLEPLPLVFHPGCSWEYSIATDVLGRLVELVTGQTLDQVFQQRIFDPLGMSDTAFVVPEHKRDRFTMLYRGEDVMDPMKPGLTRMDDSPAYLQPVPRLSGGGGLVSTLADMVALLRSLQPGSGTLFRPETIAEMLRNQLRPGVNIHLADAKVILGKGFGLAGSVTLAPGPNDPAESRDEFQWSGIAGTHWWISPRTGLAGLLMTQRQMSFWHPFSFEFKRLVYRAAGRLQANRIRPDNR